jgi:hypothetical protein
VDDFGRYDGRTAMLRAHLYPLKLEKVSEADVGKWLTECVNAGLVSLYRVQDRPYVEVLKFEQRARAKESKWPNPPSSADACQQVTANAPVFVSVVEDVFDPPKPPVGADGRFEKFWTAYPKKVGQDAARKAFDKRKPDDTLLAQMLTAIATQREGAAWTKDAGQYIPNPSTWLTEGRWKDGEGGAGNSAEVGPWHETRGGVEKRAAALGLPAWDQIEPWPLYRGRVMAKAKETA